MQGQKVLKELTDPDAHYLPQAEDLYLAGETEDALEAAQTGLQVFPNNGSLLALQALVRLEAARKGATKKLTAQDVADAQKDAAAAVAAGAVAEGQFAAGQIAEAIGDMAKAEQSYREALKAHGQVDAAGNNYRLALARVLLAPKRARPAPPPDVGDKVGQGAPINANQLSQLVALVLVAVQAADLDAPPPMPEVEEALRLAEELIKAKDPRGHLIKAQAQGKQGLWTTSLEEYTRGLKGLIKPEYANGLSFIVDNHPAFRRPDSLKPPDQLLAERHFGNGLRFYFDRQYPQAEKELLEAVRYNDQDARYLYYLGLSRLLQGKREVALEDFRVGANLERQDRPSPAAVAGSLERVQGPVRQTLNKYRP
jgi:tetratricopeptide (TPR) repeat protein